MSQRLQASSVVIDGNPSVGGALQLVATPTTGYSRSSNVAFPLVIGENIEGTMVPRSTATFQASLQTKLPMDMKTPQPPVSQISFPTVSKKQELAGARAKDVLVIKVRVDVQRFRSQSEWADIGFVLATRPLNVLPIKFIKS